MSDPNLPEGVTQKDVDAQWEVNPLIAEDETCKHGFPVCEECAVEEKENEIESLKNTLRKIKEKLDCGRYYHVPGCEAWGLDAKNIPTFTPWNCSCAIGDVLHEIEINT